MLIFYSFQFVQVIRLFHQSGMRPKETNIFGMLKNIHKYATRDLFILLGGGGALFPTCWAVFTFFTAGSSTLTSGWLPLKCEIYHFYLSIQYAIFILQYDLT